MQFPWEERPERNHGKSLDLGPFLIDRDLAAQLQRASANIQFWICAPLTGHER